MTVERRPQIHKLTARDGSEVVIRSAMKEDASDIIAAAESIVQSKEFIQKEETKTVEEEEKFITQVKEYGHLYAVIEVDGTIQGIVRILREDLEMKRHCGVFRTWLSEDTQGKGIGKSIMKYALEWGQAEGLHKIWLTVFSNNPIALKLYEKYGFEIEGRQRDQLFINGGYQDEIYMAYFFNQK